MEKIKVKTSTNAALLHEVISYLKPQTAREQSVDVFLTYIGNKMRQVRDRLQMEMEDDVVRTINKYVLLSPNPSTPATASTPARPGYGQHGTNPDNYGGPYNPSQREHYCAPSPSTRPLPLPPQVFPPTSDAVPSHEGLWQNAGRNTSTPLSNNSYGVVGSNYADMTPTTRRMIDSYLGTDRPRRHTHCQDTDF